MYSRIMLAWFVFCFPFQAFAASAVCNSTGSDIPDIKLVRIADGITDPVAITHAGDGSKRLFVLEQGGTIRIIHNGKLEKAPFLDLSNRRGFPEFHRAN